MDLRGGPYLVAEPARLGGSDALGDGSAGEKSGGSEEGGREAEQREASLPPPHRLHRVRVEPGDGRARGGRRDVCEKERIGTLSFWKTGATVPNYRSRSVCQYTSTTPHRLAQKKKYNSTSLERLVRHAFEFSLERVYSLGLSFLVFKRVLGNYSEL